MLNGKFRCRSPAMAIGRDHPCQPIVLLRRLAATNRRPADHGALTSERRNLSVTASLRNRNASRIRPRGVLSSRRVRPISVERSF